MRKCLYKHVDLPVYVHKNNYALVQGFPPFPSGFLVATSRNDPLDRTGLEADRRIARQSKTPSTRKVERERGSASSQFDLGECALALAFRLRNIITHLGR